MIVQIFENLHKKNWTNERKTGNKNWHLFHLSQFDSVFSANDYLIKKNLLKGIAKKEKKNWLKLVFFSLSKYILILLVFFPLSFEP